jgi:hypothetical protein
LQRDNSRANAKKKRDASIQLRGFAFPRRCNAVGKTGPMLDCRLQYTSASWASRAADFEELSGFVLRSRAAPLA